MIVYQQELGKENVGSSLSMVVFLQLFHYTTNSTNARSERSLLPAYIQVACIVTVGGMLFTVRLFM